MNTEATAAEIVVEIPENLALAVKSTGLEPKSAEIIEASFLPLFAQANKWKKQVEGLKVTDVSQVREMKLARDSRLALKEIRCNAEKNKDRLKEESLKRSNAIQLVYNTLKGICEPLEAELLAQEQFALRAEATRLEKIKAERVTSLTQYGVDCAFYSLDVMPAEQFEQLLAGSKAAHEAKIEVARKAEEERTAKIAAEAAERERIRLENERLRCEAFEAEKAAQAERERVAKEKHEADLKARKEREEMEAAMRKQKLAAEAKAKAAAEAAAEEARKIKEEAVRLANIAAAKARAELEAAEKKSEAEREELRRQAKAAADAQAKAEAELRRKEAEEAAVITAKVQAQQKAARAPDKEKLRDMVNVLRNLQMAPASTHEGRAIFNEVNCRIAAIAAWAEEKGGAL